MTTYSMGLRLSETLSLQVGDIDINRKQVHIRSKYLYKGVISEKNIIANKCDKVTFRYVDSEIKIVKYRTLPGEDFICLILQQILSKGFRRVDSRRVAICNRG